MGTNNNRNDWKRVDVKGCNSTLISIFAKRSYWTQAIGAAKEIEALDAAEVPGLTPWNLRATLLHQLGYCDRGLNADWSVSAWFLAGEYGDPGSVSEWLIDTEDGPDTYAICTRTVSHEDNDGISETFNGTLAECLVRIAASEVLAWGRSKEKLSDWVAPPDSRWVRDPEIDVALAMVAAFDEVPA